MSNVLLLCGLVPTNQQQKEPVRALGIVDPVSRAEIDLQFQDPAEEVPMVSRIPMDQPIDAHLDLGLPDHVAERVDPLAIFQRFFYAYVPLYPADYSLSTAPALE